MLPQAPDANSLASPRKQARGFSRRAAKEGKAKTKSLFANYNREQKSSCGLSCNVKGRDNMEGDKGREEVGLAVVCEPRVPKIAPVLIPTFYPRLEFPPALPTHWVSVASDTLHAVRTGRRHVQTPSRPFSATPSPRKKRYLPQIPPRTSGFPPNVAKPDDSEEVSVEFDDLEHPSREVLEAATCTGFVILHNPDGTTYFSRPPALLEPPPSTRPPPSFLYDYFAKKVDEAIPDD